MRWTNTPWYYVSVGLSTAAVVALLQVWWGDGIEWVSVGFITVAAMAGAYVGRRLRSRRR